MKIVGSRTDFCDMDGNETVKDFYECIADLLESDEVQRLAEFNQHMDTNRLQHCMNVTYYGFLICRKFGWDYRSAARGGLLHDLFFYDWAERRQTAGFHALHHPRVALKNATEAFELNDREKDIIVKHMWPVTLRPPKYKETLVITFVDKYCAFMEICAAVRKMIRMRSRLGFNEEAS